ncbi:hypothetical protein OIDMADRAFT_148084 [Oidiodendron maius Zn]|uniref:protein disulfide-isomerase n=1 Tax=Oidiodendron maius (strain Zn) TaxID=913774 RepID=A0A0C3H0G2_OIDMZ|nr:hypothetical protein OIDMADRAFT_148084 [Oidiodendron maius Zn]
MWDLWTLALLLVSAKATNSSAVLQLHAADFQAHLEIHSPVLVNFCLPWYIISYMIRKDLPLISEINTDNFKEILLMWSSALIAYIDQDDDEARAVFTSFAESHQNEFIYGITTDLTLAKFDARKFPFIMLYNPLDQVNPIFQESFEISKLEAFTSKYSSPLIGPFSLETYYDYTESGLPLLHIFTSSPSDDHTSLLSLLRPVAEKYKGKLNFATIDARQYGFFAKALNLVSNKFPAFVIEDTISGDTVPFDEEEEATTEKLDGFVEKYFEHREEENVLVQTVGLNRDEL